jgi:hypothetical protein
MAPLRGGRSRAILILCIDCQSDSCGVSTKMRTVIVFPGRETPMALPSQVED